MGDRRTVTISARVPRGKWVKARLWAYGYADIAAACGMTIASIRKACAPRRGKEAALDPSDLVSLAAFITKHRKKGVEPQ